MSLEQFDGPQGNLARILKENEDLRQQLQEANTRADLRTRSHGLMRSVLSPEDDADKDRRYVAAMTALEDAQRKLTLAEDALRKVQILTEAWNSLSFQSLAKKVAAIASDALAAITGGR